MMKTLLLLALTFFIWCTPAKAQNTLKDTLDYVEHSGTIFIVKDKKTLSFPEIKRIIKNNPAAFEQFKKARRIRNLAFVLETVSTASLLVGLISENDQVFLIGAGGSVIITSLQFALLPEPYNNALLECIEEYNSTFRSK